MGYHVHITRAPHTFYENEGREISESEWLALVAADPELRLATPADPYYFTGMVLWLGHEDADSCGPWFAWGDGNVYTKRPTSVVLTKMLAIAGLLGARVQGDLGHVYRADGQLVDINGAQVGLDWRTHWDKI